MTAPTSPNSSPNTAKMKSVCRSGRKSRCVCVPFNHPFPTTPPEPSASDARDAWEPLRVIVARVRPDERRGGGCRGDETGNDFPREAGEIKHVEARRGDQQ